MKWATSISVDSDPSSAVAQACQLIAKELGEEATPDLLLLFVSTEHLGDIESIADDLLHAYPRATLIGSMAQAVIGGGRECEGSPAISITAASLPGVTLDTFHVDAVDYPDADAAPQTWRKMTLQEGETPTAFILLSDPFSAKPEQLLEGLDYAFPETVKIGGLVSGARVRDGNRLCINRLCLTHGTVGLSLSGNIQVDTVLAQGCRPVGDPLTVTRCDTYTLQEVNGETPLRYISRMAQTLTAADRDLVSRALFLGLDSTPLLEDTDRTQYLIRNIMGIDTEAGTLNIGARLHKGMRVHFHVRDKDASHRDLAERLLLHSIDRPDTPPRAAILFSCLGRGKGLYGQENHDSDMFQEALGPIPLAGFFCNGEMGPVGDTTYLHSYTSAFAVFSEKESL